jgi:hypothetical protein
MDAAERLKYPYCIVLRYTPRRALWEFSSIHHQTDVHRSQARFTPTQSLRSCRVSSTTKSLKAHGLHRSNWSSPPVRPVHLSDRPSVVCRAPVFGLRSWLCGSTKKLNDFVVNHCKPRGLGAASMIILLMTWPPRLSRLGLGFEAQLRNRTRIRLVVLATMRPTHDPVGHRVPRTKPTCLSTLGGHTDIDLSRLFFTCTNANQNATCTCNNRPRASPHNVVNHPSLRSDLPPVLKCTQVLNNY